MAEEHITRGQIIRIVQKISLRHPRGLTKEWLYSMLKPVVDALEADLKETGQLSTDPTDTPEKDGADKEPEKVKQQESPASAPEKDGADKEPEKVKQQESPASAPEKDGQTDLGDTPKKPVEEKGNKTKQGNKPKENKK